MGRKSNKERIQRFQRDVALLRTKYAQNVIAERMGTDSGNLSNYSRGSKNPGEDFLDKFYSVFAAEIPEPANDFSREDHGPVFTVEEPIQEFKRPDDRDDHIQTLKLNNEDLRIHLTTIIRNNEILVLSNQKLVDAQMTLMVRLGHLPS